MTRSLFSRVRSLAIVSVVSVLLITASAWSGPALEPGTETALRDLLSRECNNLNAEKLLPLLTAKLAADLERGIAPDLFRIMEGVIKRTDFDGIPEEKTAEIIDLVYKAYQQGAPLEFLDEIFDVAYVNVVSVEQLAAAAHALKELHNSDVPQDIYEEFVYHSIEDRWDPSAVPVLTRGLIYGVERGLSPNRVALIIMLDVKNGELKNKKPGQVVLESLQLVREKEPGAWRPLTPLEREREAARDRTRTLEQKQRDLDDDLQQKERAFLQARKELKELREYPAGRDPRVDADKVNRDLEALIRRLQEEIDQNLARRRDVVAELEATRRSMERQQAVRERERRQQRDRELLRKQQDIATHGKRGRLDRDKLVRTVERYLGTPYRFGGDSERGIDCSAFTRRVYRSQNIELPRTSREQARVGMSVFPGSLSTGDLIFFNTSINGVISHVGVYLGNNVFAHASSSKGVTKSSLKERYYAKRLVKGGRIFNE